MRSMFHKNLATSGKPFTNERTSICSQGILVLNQGKPHIDFSNDTDVHSADWLINSVGERLFITNIEPISNYKSCYYVTEFQYNQTSQSPTTFNISAERIENSIIGNQQNAAISLNEQIQKMKSDISCSDSSDKEDLLKIVALLEEIKDTQESVPKGFLSKFSAIMERNSWITNSIASFLLNLFLNR